MHQFIYRNFDKTNMLKIKSCIKRKAGVALAELFQKLPFTEDLIVKRGNLAPTKEFYMLVCLIQVASMNLFTVLLSPIMMLKFST